MEKTDALARRIIGLMQEKRCVWVAVDGMAASGKTTLAAALAARLPSCHVVHMDDFTIPFEDRYPGYFERELSNADVYRFDRDIMTPLLRGEHAVYRPYRCHPNPGFLSPVTIPADTACVIVEGAYCLHPLLAARYDLRILMTIDEELQRRRILARNGEEQLRRFSSIWIPMENRHIAARRLHSLCDLVIRET